MGDGATGILLPRRLQQRQGIGPFRQRLGLIQISQARAAQRPPGQDHLVAIRRRTGCGAGGRGLVPDRDTGKVQPRRPIGHRAHPVRDIQHDPQTDLRVRGRQPQTQVGPDRGQGQNHGQQMQPERQGPHRQRKCQA